MCGFSTINLIFEEILREINLIIGLPYICCWISQSEDFTRFCQSQILYAYSIIYKFADDIVIAYHLFFVFALIYLLFVSVFVLPFPVKYIYVD